MSHSLWTSQGCVAPFPGGDSVHTTVAESRLAEHVRVCPVCVLLSACLAPHPRLSHLDLARSDLVLGAGKLFELVARAARLTVIRPRHTERGARAVRVPRTALLRG